MNEDVKNFYDICIDKVCDWLEEEEVSVEFISEPGNFYYYEDGIISICSHQSIKSKLFSLLHEAGHHIVRKNKTWANNPKRNNKDYRVGVLMEEVLSWSTAESIAQELDIWSGIDDKEWNKFVKKQLYDYACWTANPKKYVGE